MAPPPTATAERYRRFAAQEAAGSSPTSERLARAVAGSAELLQRLDAGLPPAKRQPNLLLAAARLLDAPLDGHRFVPFLLDRWDEVADVLATRATQTNEAARTGAFLPVLAALDGPLALIEVGCSAGLCLYPDRYSISYDGHPPLVPDSPVTIPVITAGAVPLPSRRPHVVARIGIDLHPLDVTDADDLAWLEACIWPEHDVRRERLRTAAGLVAADPPQLIEDDLVDGLDDALARVPAGATPVVFHSAVLNYLSPDHRAWFAREVLARHDVVWLANEAPTVLPGVATSLAPPAGATTSLSFILTWGGSRPLAIGDPHGAWIRWPDRV